MTLVKRVKATTEKTACCKTELIRKLNSMKLKLFRTFI